MAEENKNDGVKGEEEMAPEDLKILQESEEFIENFKDEDFEDPDKAEEIRKRLKDAQTTIHQKRHYRDKVKDLAKELETLKKPPEEKKPEKKEEKKEGSDSVHVDPIVALTFRQDHPEVPRAVVQEILDYAGVKQITPEEALKKSFIQTMIKEEKTKEDAEDAGISPTRKGAPEGGKKDWSNASEADVRAQRNKILNQPPAQS